MKSSDESSSCASSTSGSVVNSAKNTSASFTVIKSNKPWRNVVIPENELKLQKAQRRKQITENEREQQRLDLDIILSGFPERPVCKTVVNSFLKIHQISSEKVRTSFQFENRSSDGTVYHIVITFEDRLSKIQLFAAHSQLPTPVYWHQVSGKNRTGNNPIIRFNNRFSKFNLLVERQLRGLEHWNIIAKFEFGDLFYRYKETSTSEWRKVSVEEDIKDLLDSLEKKKKINKIR